MGKKCYIEDEKVVCEKLHRMKGKDGKKELREGGVWKKKECERWLFARGLRMRMVGVEGKAK